MKTEIKKLQLNLLNPTEGNPQKMTDKTFDGLVESIKRKGWYFAMPDIWESSPGDYKIISGHHRIQAALKSGIVEQNCNVIIDPNYSEEQARKDLLESNERHGDPDPDLLQDFVIDLVDNFDVNIDDLVDDIGFDDSILNDILSQDDEKDDEVPEVPEVAFSKLGDLYLLNGHRVLCGDSTDEKQVEFLMDGKKADMVFTDPPYDGKMGGRGFRNDPELEKRRNKMRKSVLDIYTFDPLKTFEIYNIIKKDKINGYFFCNKNLIPKYLSYAIENKIKFFILLWHKPNYIPLSSNHYYPDTEYIIKFQDSGACFNTGLKKDQTTYNTYWILESLKGQKKEGVDHPTIKPLKIITECLFVSSKINDLIVDLFLGSGSTLAAAEKTNRICYGMELKEQYTDVTVKRYINYTGTKDNCFLIRDNNKIPLSDIREFDNE